MVSPISASRIPEPWFICVVRISQLAGHYSGWTLQETHRHFAGNAQALPLASGVYNFPRVSPDGTQIALAVTDGSGRNIAVYDWMHNRLSKLTFTGPAEFPVWAKDGKHIVYTLSSGKSPGIYWIRSDGAGNPRRLIEGQNLSPNSFSPDGKHLAYQRRGTRSEIWTVPLSLEDPERPKPGTPQLYLDSKGAQTLGEAAFSPDGRWIAYMSDESGQFEIFVRPFPGLGGKWQVSSGGGVFPQWAPDSQKLFYRATDRIMEVLYATSGDSFVAGQPKAWSGKAFSNIGVGGAYAYQPAPDGKRFVVVMSTSAAAPAELPTHVTFLLNFADELRRKVPVSGK